VIPYLAKNPKQYSERKMGKKLAERLGVETKGVMEK